ncbi:MAG TPA: GrpB family protein [Candidatus Saccharimonadales bacterium]
MKLYRFSPIQNKEELLEAITFVHLACNYLCRQSFGEYLPNAGNIGIFCHYDDEYEQLTTLRKEMTEESDNVNQKYFRLHEPIIIPERVFSDRIFFPKGPRENRTHHLSLVLKDSSGWHDPIRFRDYLIANPKVREEYQNLKLELAKRYPDDRASYTKAKEVMIQDIMETMPCLTRTTYDSTRRP